MLMPTHRPTAKGGCDKFGKSSTIALHHHEDVHRAHLNGMEEKLIAAYMCEYAHIFRSSRIHIHAPSLVLTSDI